MKAWIIKLNTISLHWSVATALLVSAVSIFIVTGTGTYYLAHISWTSAQILAADPGANVTPPIATSDIPAEITPSTEVSPSSAPTKSPTKKSTTTPKTTTTPTPTLTPTPETIAYLIGAGDIASCTNDLDEATAAVIDAYPSDTVYTLGDNVYDSGTATEFANCYTPTWGRHKARTRPSTGNHDYHTTGATGYYNYFGSAAGDPNKGYYTYTAGAWQIIVLNSNCASVSCSAGSAQETWLRATLAASTSPCTLAYWHHARFNSGATHGNNTAVAPFWQALYDYNADVVLVGHEHIYERFAPQNPSAVADAARGIRQFTVGTGGRSFYSIGTIQPNSEVRNNATNGVLRLTLKSNSYSWNFLPIAGASFTDSGTSNCH